MFKHRFLSPISKIINMAKRRKIRGRYYWVRERSTIRGSTGTVMGKWKKKKKKGWFESLFG